MTTSTRREGFVEVPGGSVWYQIVGEGNGVPLLTLHGGPGAGHDYLDPLDVLGDERPVVFYDQLGCGKSDIPEDDSLWVVERFVAELASLRQALGLDTVHLLGQSWGGMLAIEYMLSQPTGIVSLVLADTAASMTAFEEDARRLLADLPADVRETIERCEAEGKTDSPEYQAATLVFYQRHICRLPEWPEPLMRTLGVLAATPVYGIMWGPSEFKLTGTLAGWDRSERLGEIDVPTLVLSGRYDEAGPACQKTLTEGIRQAEVRLFENSSHMPHVEEPEAFFAAVRDFLRRAEAGQS
ncbi:MAG TPA: proline iminopeptidase-family hydrolase [Dehalococcoidia bacterium]|jgi:proline iminopeptidase|nr:proline iminopeptidase-family hydrolase [Dehalococcoidia bacterium]